MQAKELQEKALKVSQLEWWLQNPTIKSFFLRSESTGSDEGSYYIEVENRNYWLTTDPLNEHEDGFDGENDYYDYETHSGFSTKTYYPVNINESHYERVYRPSMTDTEIQGRIDTILSMAGGVCEF